ncbi:MAG: UDP-4-amino-4,6-dideoxy-N-acetyl-beta-L-altrosamine N-acetyltransferase [Planctomycetes bacterium]|nr:UDP-4-amino-4,6-dideoxy-N-acetyl-beta-L-altrosamine N-acetyltransferase [Planctomycetota bacterium]
MSAASPKQISLVPLVSLDLELQLKIREIRNEENVRKWMYTDHVIEIDEHLAWIERLKHDDRQIVFAVRDGAGVPLGVVSVNAIDRRHQKADWAYYLTEAARGGLGSAIEFSFINFIFEALGLEKLNCEVIAGNDGVVKLHRRFLFEEEGFRRSNIVKDYIRQGVHLLGLTKSDWLAGRDRIQAEYGAIFSRFQISIHWQSGAK